MVRGYTFSDRSVRAIAEAVRGYRRMTRREPTPTRLLPTDNPSVGGVRLCIVRTNDPDGAGVCIRIAWIRGDRILMPDVDALVWPGCRAADYATFSQPDGFELRPETTVVWATRDGPVWLVAQAPRWAYISGDYEYRRTDCTPWGMAHGV